MSYDVNATSSALLWTCFEMEISYSKYRAISSSSFEEVKADRIVLCSVDHVITYVFLLTFFLHFLKLNTTVKTCSKGFTKDIQRSLLTKKIKQVEAYCRPNYVFIFKHTFIFFFLE